MARSSEAAGRRSPQMAIGWWESHARGAESGKTYLTLLQLPRILRAGLVFGLRSARLQVVVALMTGLIGGAATSVALWSTRGVLQHLLSSTSEVLHLDKAAPDLMLLGAAVTVRTLTTLVISWMQALIEPRVLADAEHNMLSLITKVPLAAFDDPEFADEMDLARSRGGTAVHQMVRIAIDLSASVAALIGTAFSLFIIDPALLIALFLAVVPSAIGAVRASRMGYALMRQRTSRRRKMSVLSHFMASRETAGELRSLGLRRQLLARFGDMSMEELDSYANIVSRQVRTRFVFNAMSGLASTLVYFLLASLLASGRLQIAAMGAAVLAIQGTRQALTTALVSVNLMYEQSLYFCDYENLLRRANSLLSVKLDRAPVAAPHRISAVAVNFLYPSSQVIALNKVDLEVQRGEVIGLVGENGSGKSTLAKLLIGLYNPSTGSVLWDGEEIAEHGGEGLWKHVAVVSQDCVHWPFTVRDNITMSGTTIPLDADIHMKEAAMRADIDRTVDGLPDRYDTLLSKEYVGGHDLSGGQWQRLAAARAFYRDAPILVCDEPSSALDARAEHHLFSNLLKGSENRITILTTHRLANVVNADRIYLLHEGHLIESGTHASLIRAGGQYASMFRLQASGYIEAMTEES